MSVLSALIKMEEEDCMTKSERVEAYMNLSHDDKIQFRTYLLYTLPEIEFNTFITSCIRRYESTIDEHDKCIEMLKNKIIQLDERLSKLRL